MVSSPPDVGVVLVAAGRGLRAGAGAPKQFRLLGGVPLLLRSLRPFASHPAVAHVVIVVPAEVADRPPGWLHEATGSAVSLVVGGTERADSVVAGLRALPDTCGVVLVHDGARPFPPRDGIDQVIASARGGRAALLAMPVTDTLKAAAPDAPRRVTATLAREGIWGAQTPQGFPRPLLERAHAAHLTANGVTDDAQLVERLGEPVDLVPGSATNIKITDAGDFALAEAMLAAGITT